MTYQFLISIIRPGLDIQKNSFFLILEEDVLSQYSTIEEFHTLEKTIVSFDFDHIANFQRNTFGSPKINFVDVEQMAKQLDGRPAKAFRKHDNLPWLVWNRVVNFYKEENLDSLQIMKDIYFSRDYSKLGEIKAIGEYFLKGLRDLYNDLLDKMRENDEEERYFEVEKKIAGITFNRSLLGISINNSNLNSWINSISEELYSYRNKLQLQYSIFSSEEKVKIIAAIKKCSTINDVENKINERGFYPFLKTYKANNELIELLYREKKASRNRSVLLSIGATEAKIVYPSYDSLGTVTARTKMNSPNFQILSKKYRTVVSAGVNKVLVYIDYRQFEACILANESKDSRLLEFCNSSDVYDELSKTIGLQEFISDPVDQRNFSKILFFKYSYGMDITNHATLLNDFGLKDFADKMSPRINQAFAEFGELDKYRSEIVEELKTSGKIGTKQGNYRYKEDADQNVSWALSQRIQGTASLILKKAIILVIETNPDIEFLIPMHDAALFQVDAERRVEMESIIKESFLSTFKNECLLITSPKVKIQEFHL